nr:hypothetical protein Iba_chr01dCG10040 [Ipomoea batatas]
MFSLSGMAVSSTNVDFIVNPFLKSNSSVFFKDPSGKEVGVRFPWSGGEISSSSTSPLRGGIIRVVFFLSGMTILASSPTEDIITLPSKDLSETEVGVWFSFWIWITFIITFSLSGATISSTSSTFRGEDFIVDPLFKSNSSFVFKDSKPKPTLELLFASLPLFWITFIVTFSLSEVTISPTSSTFRSEDFIVDPLFKFNLSVLFKDPSEPKLTLFASLPVWIRTLEAFPLLDQMFKAGKGGADGVNDFIVDTSVSECSESRPSNSSLFVSESSCENPSSS